MSNADPSLEEPIIYEVTPEDRQWAMFAHLSSLIAMWLGWLGFLGPLIVWLIKKDQSKFVDDQGKEALNFQLNMLLAIIVLGMLTVPIAFLTLFIGLIVIIPTFLVLFALEIIMPIVAALKVNAGETYRYPYIIRIVA